VSAFFSVAEVERISVFMVKARRRKGEGGGGDVPNSQCGSIDSQVVQVHFKLNFPKLPQQLKCDKQSVIYTPKNLFAFFNRPYLKYRKVDTLKYPSKER